MDGKQWIDNAIDPRAIAEQAAKVRALYPELYRALDDRDRELRRALAAIPNEHDPESIVSPVILQQALATLRTLTDGIADLCDAGY